MNLRAHLARVDWGYVAIHTAGAILGTLIAVWFATGDRYGLTTAENWAWTTAVAAGATVAFDSTVFAGIAIAHPGVLPQDTGRRYEKRITRLTAAAASLRGRVGELIHENSDLEAENATLTAAAEAMDVDYTGLAGELADTRASLTAALDLIDSLTALTATSDPDDTGDRRPDELARRLLAMANAEYLRIGPPPGYGQDIGEAK